MRASKTETTEGEVHLCEWAKLGKEFQIRVVGKPDWVGVGKTFEAAEEELLEKVIEATNDMQPCFEYTAEPPKNAIKARLAGIGFPLADKVMPKRLFDEKDRLQEDGFYCKECGRKQLTGIPQGSGGLYTFISEADLPRPLPSCFQVGQCSSLEFCMTKNRWEQLVGKSGTKRLLSRQIGILKRSWVNLNPKLRLLDAQSAGQ